MVSLLVVDMLVRLLVIRHITERDGARGVMTTQRAPSMRGDNMNERRTLVRTLHYNRTMKQTERSLCPLTSAIYEMTTWHIQHQCASACLPLPQQSV